MIFLNMLYDFCNEISIFIDFSLDKLEYYDELNIKRFNEIIINDEFRNHVSIVGIQILLDDYDNKNEFIFAILQKLGFRRELMSEKKETEIIQTIKFITDELKNTLYGNFSLEVNDFPGRFILNMISDLILSKELLDSYFDGEMYILNIFNACVEKDQRLYIS